MGVKSADSVRVREHTAVWLCTRHMHLLSSSPPHPSVSFQFSQRFKHITKEKVNLEIQKFGKTIEIKKRKLPACAPSLVLLFSFKVSVLIFFKKKYFNKNLIRDLQQS